MQVEHISLSNTGHKPDRPETCIHTTWSYIKIKMFWFQIYKNIIVSLEKNLCVISLSYFSIDELNPDLISSFSYGSD